MQRVSWLLIFLAVGFTIASSVDLAEKQMDGRDGNSPSPVWQYININIGPPASYLAFVLLVTAFWIRREVNGRRKSGTTS